MELKPSKPFSNGTEYEFFLESFCYRCKKHKVDKDGFCAFVEDGGCPIENAMEDARFGYDFPSEDIVQRLTVFFGETKAQSEGQALKSFGAPRRGGVDERI